MGNSESVQLSRASKSVEMCCNSAKGASASNSTTVRGHMNQTHRGVYKGCVQGLWIAWRTGHCAPE